MPLFDFLFNALFYMLSCLLGY